MEDREDQYQENPTTGGDQERPPLHQEYYHPRLFSSSISTDEVVDALREQTNSLIPNTMFLRLRSISLKVVLVVPTLKYLLDMLM